MNSRERDVLSRILEYCAEIEETMSRFGDDIELFTQDKDYKKSVVFSFLQIGELTIQLSDEFRAEHPDIPWRQIRGMRNIVAHHYGKLDEKIIFESVHNDVPDLKQFIAALLKNEV